MALNEQEEFELLSLEREKSLGGGRASPSAPAGPKYIAPHNAIMGALKGASDIGTTLLRPVDAALNATGLSDRTNVDRRASMDQFFREQADPESGWFRGAELLTNVAGTAGAGGVLAKGAQALGAGGKTVAALESGGFRLGPTAATGAAGRVGDLGLRVGAGAAGGAAAAGLVNPEDAVSGGVIGGALPGGVKVAGTIGKALGSKGVNSTLTQTLQDAQAAGYVVPPSMAGAGTGSRLLEGLSGKYKTNQAAAIRNQEVTDDLARQAVGLPQGAPITSEAMQQIRENAFQSAYAPITSITTPLATGSKYLSELDNIAKQYSGPAKTFPGVAKADVQDLVDSFKKVKAFPAGDAVGAIQILRDNAGDAFRAGNNALGKANREIADVLENQIEDELTRMGQSGAAMLQKFREGRTLMAKAHTVEDAIREGGGMVNARSIASAYQKAPKRLSGELETIGKFANNFGDVATVPKSGFANPLTVFDYTAGGAGYMTDNPELMALPVGRVAARKTILSKPYQQRFVSGAARQPSRVNALLENPVLRNALIQSGGE